nr:reverse transcriptase domain-containing protein [Tanacetum cinerariifolium]
MLCTSRTTSASAGRSVGTCRYDGDTKKSHKHSLNVNPLMEPVAQKRRVIASDRTQAVSKEVEEWVSAGIVRPVRYPTWISNPVFVKKSDESWRMCIDFKYVNSACPKDYYPLPNIDGKIESVVGLRYKCFLYAYKGYHQIESNLEAYVDDMVIKSNDEKILIKDITETFDNLRRINMKLNPRKCSFGVEEGKILGYMVTFEVIRANQKKTKAIADMQSPQTLKEMQSLSGKLAALKRFLSQSAERSLPFFKILKDITKENRDEYRWTERAENEFQEMKKVIVELSLLTTLVEEETLYVYVAAATEADLNEAKKNYASLEKLALSLLHMSKRLRRTGFNGLLVRGAGRNTHRRILSIISQLPNQDDMGRRTLFRDEASNSKGSGASLVLINPSDVEFTYPLQLNFASMNNKAKCEYNQKVRPMSFKLDKYVFKRNEASRVKDQGKLGPKWKGPYRVTEAYHNGSYKLQTMRGNEVPKTWHAINLRKCYCYV